MSISKKAAMCCLIEKQAGFTIKSSADFSRLAELIATQTKEYVSETTLKRLFGYIEGWQNPRPGVWNILSRFVGFANEDAFCKAYGLDPEAISGVVTVDSLPASKLHDGAEVELRWYPDRYLRTRYAKDGIFEILEAQNTRLQAGGRFHTDCFIAGDALLLNPYYPPNTDETESTPILYEIGRTGGIEFTVEA